MDPRDEIVDLKRRLAAAEERLRGQDRLGLALRETEARYHILIKSWTQAEWETDADGVAVSDSPSWRAYTGQTLEEWLGYGWLDAIHPEDRAYAERQWREAMAAHAVVNAEFRLHSPDGGWRWTNVRAAPLLGPEGLIEKWVGVNIDIDDRKRAEEARRIAEERLLAASEAARLQVTATLESIGDAFYAVDAEFRLTYVNAKAEAMWGRSRETLIGRNLWSEFPEAVGSEHHAKHLIVMRERRPVHSDGLSPVLGRWMEASIYPDPASGGLACYFRDVSERRLAEAALRESEARYRLLFEGIEDGFCVVEVLFDADDRPFDYRFLNANPAFERQTGLADPTGKTILSMVPTQEPFWVETYGRIARTGQSERFDHQSGAMGRWFEVDATPLGDPRDNQVALVFRDVLHRRKAEEALREREADLARVQRIGEVGGLDIDIAHGMRSIRSPEYLRLHGLPRDSCEESHADWLARVHPDDRASAERGLIAALASDAVNYDGEYRIVRPSDGEVRWIHARADIARDADGKAVRMVGAHIDVTEQKRSNEALRESQARLEAAFQSVPVGIAVIDVTGHAILSNAEFRRFLPNGVIASRDERGVARWRAWDEQGAPLKPEDWPSARALRGETVVPGQEMLFTDDSGREIWTSVSTAPTLDADGNVSSIVSVVGDIDAAKRARAALAESEERYRTLFESMDEAYAVLDVLKDADGAWSNFRFVQVNPAFITHTGMPWPIGKTATELLGAPNPRWTQLYALALDTGEAIRVEEAEPTLGRVFDLNIFTLDRERNRVAVLFTNITERKRAAAALLESEARFQQFAASSSDILWIRDAKTLAVEFMSAAAREIYGVDPDMLLGDPKPGIAMIVPEDREDVFANIARVQDGQPVVHDYRIQRPDGAFRWMRSTGFPLFNAAGEVEKIGGISADVTERKRLTRHQGVLVAELQHRVRNIMGMIRSMAKRTATSAQDISEYQALLEGRLLALARVQVLLTREANAGGSLRGVIESEVAAQASNGVQFTLSGPDIRLSPKAVEVLTLAFHELATNALKYGALSTPEGRLSVAWTIDDRRSVVPWLTLDWIETGSPSRPCSTRRGFGSELIEARIPYELNGRGSLSIWPEGARCHLEFPLTEGESILETDAPQPATIFGGNLDMSGVDDLTGYSVLVVEDDYYMASDAAAALRGAGAAVLGPCASEDAAIGLLGSATPTHAVLDLNLGGGGPRFEVARRLQQRGIPFLFLTGYDAGVIPAEFVDVVRLQKPLTFAAVVDALGRLPP